MVRICMYDKVLSLQYDYLRYSDVNSITRELSGLKILRIECHELEILFLERNKITLSFVEDTDQIQEIKVSFRVGVSRRVGIHGF